MKCQSCGKKEATVRYKENINGKKQEYNFCYECAKKLGFVEFSNVFSPMFMDIPNYLLEEQESCPTCGYTLGNYKQTGVFGCPDCYDVFDSELDKLLMKFHGKNRHIKINENVVGVDELTKPVKNNKKENKEKVESVESLKLKLKDLVQNEQYEQAAVIRDRIKELEGK